MTFDIKFEETFTLYRFFIQPFYGYKNFEIIGFYLVFENSVFLGFWINFITFLLIQRLVGYFDQELNLYIVYKAFDTLI